MSIAQRPNDCIGGVLGVVVCGNGVRKSESKVHQAELCTSDTCIQKSRHFGLDEHPWCRLCAFLIFTFLLLSINLKFTS